MADSELLRMKRQQGWAYLSAAVTLSLLVTIKFLYIDFAGFPDGHLTDLERAEITLFKVFACVAVPFSGYFLYCARTHSKETADRRFLAAASVLILLAVLSLGLKFYLGMHLDHGQGG